MRLMREGAECLVLCYRWMAPEVIEHNPYREKADVFSFGITMWELLTARVPYEQMTPLQAAVGVVQKGLRPTIPPACPEALAALLRDCWQKDPRERPPFEALKVRALRCLRLQKARPTYCDVPLMALCVPCAHGVSPPDNGRCSSVQTFAMHHISVQHASLTCRAACRSLSGNFSQCSTRKQHGRVWSLRVSKRLPPVHHASALNLTGCSGAGADGGLVEGYAAAGGQARRAAAGPAVKAAQEHEQQRPLSRPPSAGACTADLLSSGDAGQGMPEASMREGAQPCVGLATAWWSGHSHMSGGCKAT